MKIGSLVECVGAKQSENDKAIVKILSEQRGYIIPEYGVIYTVRGFTMSGKGIWLEEIVNPKTETTQGFIEVGFTIKSFREVQPPMDLSELMKEVNEIELQHI